jgi:hypothetical protein
MFSGLFAALIIALIITVIAAALGRKGPWGAAWSLFLVLFLGLWLVTLFLRAVGPVYYGIAWVPLLIAGVLLALLLVAAIPDANHWRDASIRNTDSGKVGDVREDRQLSGSGVSGFFWVLIMLMVMAIIIGMLNPQAAL